MKKVLLFTVLVAVFISCENSDKGTGPDVTSGKYRIISAIVTSNDYFYENTTLDFQAVRIAQEAPNLSLAELSLNSNSIYIYGNQDTIYRFAWESYAETSGEQDFYLELKVANETMEVFKRSQDVGSVNITEPTAGINVSSDDDLTITWEVLGSGIEYITVFIYSNWYYEEYCVAKIYSLGGHQRSIIIPETEVENFNGWAKIKVVGGKKEYWSGSVTSDSYLLVGNSDEINIRVTNSNPLPLNPPSALHLVGTTDGLGLDITWNPSSTTDIDGYRIYFDGSLIWEGTATTFTHAYAPLGEYEIAAYRGSEESDYITHDTHDDVQTGTGKIYAFYVSGQPSGYGWNLSSGIRSSYSFTSGNAAYIDFYYDSDDDLTSADVYSIDFPNSTGFINSSITYHDLNVIPSTSYHNYVTPELNDTYAIIVLKDRSYGNYGKMQITSINSSEYSISFRWTLQTIEKWRVVGV